MFCTRRSPFLTFNLFTIQKSIPYRTFITSPKHNMPETLTKEEVNSQTDPSVSKQYDTNVSYEESIKDLYSICDGLKIAMLGTYRPGIGVRILQYLPTTP